MQTCFLFPLYRGIEWVSLHSFLSFAHPAPGQSGLTRNEVMLTDIQTGKLNRNGVDYLKIDFERVFNLFNILVTATTWAQQIFIIIVSLGIW